MINILLLFWMAAIVHVTLWKEIWLALAFFSSVSPQEEEERGLTSAINCLHSTACDDTIHESAGVDHGAIP